MINTSLYSVENLICQNQKFDLNKQKTVIQEIFNAQNMLQQHKSQLNKPIRFVHTNFSNGQPTNYIEVFRV